MAPLESLTDELIGRIFNSAVDLQSAVSLSTANRKLNRIWRQSTERFAEDIISTTIPAYEQAIDLAVAEQRLEGNSTSTNERPSVQYYAHRLLRNHKLAMSAATTWAVWLEDCGPDDYRQSLKFTCAHNSYYVLRKLVLAYRYPQAQYLRHPVLAALKNSPRAMLKTHIELSVFLGTYASEEERALHGIDMPEEDWAPEDEYEQNVELPEWEYAGEVVWCALLDCIHGSAKLEPAMNAVPATEALNLNTSSTEDQEDHNTFSEEEQENQDPADLSRLSSASGRKRYFSAVS